MTTRPVNITTHQVLTWLAALFMTLATPILYWMGNTLMSVHESQIRQETIPGQVKELDGRVDKIERTIYYSNSPNTNDE